jgi:hypothetical protein
MNDLNMGVLQGTASKMGYSDFIEWAKTLDLNEEQKKRLWQHWKSNKRAEVLRQEQYERNKQRDKRRNYR